MLLPPAKFFTQPPTQAGLDFGNPILTGIEHAISGNAAFLTRGKYNTSVRTSTAAPTLVRRPSGLSYNLSGSTSYLATDAGDWVTEGKEWTVFTLNYWRGGSVNRALFVVAESPGSATRDRALQASNAAGGFFQVSAFDTALRTVNSTTTMSTIGTNAFSLAGRATTSELAVFVNGAKEGTTALTAPGRTTYISPEIVVGYGGTGNVTATQQSNSDLSLVLVWSRALSDEELASLHRNPWQVFKSANRILVPEAAAANNYVLETNAGAYSLTGSSAQTLLGRVTETTPGAYNITGESAQTILGRATVVDPGAYNITGADAQTLLGRTAEVDPGAYDITGSNAELILEVPGQFVLETTPGVYNITGSPTTLTLVSTAAGGGPGGKARRGWANERERFEASLRTDEVPEQIKAARRVLKKAQSESAQRLGELVAEYEAARASLDELREQVSRIERESRLREEVEVAAQVVEIFAREEEELLAILDIIDEMDARAVFAAAGIAA